MVFAGFALLPVPARRTWAFAAAGSRMRRAGGALFALSAMS